MKNEYSVKEKLTLFLLTCGVMCFGFILPDSLSNHTKLVHFSAHFGMSFLLALCFYLFSTVKMRMSKALSYTILIMATLLIGVVYKYWEMATQNMFDRFSFTYAVQLSGAMTSMSQNLSGLMAGMLLIEGLVDKNLTVATIKAGINSAKESTKINLEQANISLSKMGSRKFSVPMSPLDPRH